MTDVRKTNRLVEQLAAIGRWYPGTFEPPGTDCGWSHCGCPSYRGKWPWRAWEWPGGTDRHGRTARRLRGRLDGENDLRSGKR
jgi:hypothetical protein